MRRVVRGAAGALAAVVSVSCDYKMVTNHPLVVCPSFNKASHSYFGDILLNKSGLWVALARKVGVFSPTLRLLSL